MKLGLKGNWLPNSEAEYADNILDMGYRTCVYCNKGFSVKNVFTHAGWKETQISGICESCFNGLFVDENGGEE